MALSRLIRLMLLVLWFAPVAAPSQSARDERPAVITTNRPIQDQIKRTFHIRETSVFASNDFDGARLNDFIHTGGSTYKAVIRPENAPINNSAWYAFKLWSPKKQSVQVRLAYENGKHRYPPQISHDRIQWERLDSSRCSRDENSMVLNLEIGPKPLYVAAQEMFTSTDFKAWIDRMSQRPFIKSSVIGKSTRGKPIHKLEISEAGKDADYLVLIGRQHPPEVTGTFALLSFVETVSGNSELARAFRKQFKIIVVPMINPDGVDAGHWRHNVHGVDLNRDWGQFNQQETRVVRDELLRIKKIAPDRIRFGLDFHSTQKDVFYTVSEPRQANIALGNGDGNAGGNLLDFTMAERWLKALQERVPDHRVVIEPSPYRDTGVTLVSTAWMHRELNTPSVTYEVGDQTDRQLIRKVANASAMALMELLLAPAEALADSAPLTLSK